MTSHHSATRLATFVALLCATVIAGVAAPTHAAPARPTGLQLALTGSPVLEWQRVPGASGYRVEIVDGSTSKVLVSATTTNRRYVPTRRVATKSTVIWKVQAVAGSQRSAFASISRPSPANPAPLLDSPDNGATLPQPAEPPLLQWIGVPAAEKYLVDVSRDAGFLSAKTYTTQSTSIVVPDVQANENYWWRVTADLGSGLLSPRSAPRSYTIGRLGEVRARIVDDSDDRVPDTGVEDVVFDWDPVPGAVTYELWVSSDSDFNKTGATVERLDDIKGTRYSPAITYHNDEYYWKVRAVNARGPREPC